MEKRILERLGISNFILSLLIVCHHAFTADITFNGSFNPFDYGLEIAFQRLMYNLSECAVPIFFFLSAYLFYRNYSGNFNDYKRKVKSRFFSLFIPYILFVSFGYVKHLFASGTCWSVIGWIKELWFCETMPLWFIRELMALVILAPFFFWIKKKNVVSILLVLLIIVLITYGFIPYRSFVYWIPVYLSGIHVNSSLWSNIESFTEKYKWGVIAFTVLYVCSCWFLPNETEHSYLDNFIYIIFRIATPIAYLPIMIMIAKSKLVIRKWMGYSFFVYLVHFPVISILTIICEKYLNNFKGAQFLNYCLIVIITYVVCVLISMFLQQYLPRIWSIINGRR